VIRQGLLAALALLALPARAEEACTPVVQALLRLGDAPQYHWTMRATTPKRRRPMEREQIVLGDVVYLTPDEGRWMRQQLSRADRAARMQAELARTPPEACTREPGDKAAMVVYTYHQGTARKRIWIGAADGLPHDLSTTPTSSPRSIDHGPLRGHKGVPA